MMEDGNYLVYRDNILVIPKEEADGYTVSYAEGRRTAFLSPAISEADLAGWKGIALLGDTVTEDRVLIFDGESMEEDGRSIIPLEDVKELTLL